MRSPETPERPGGADTPGRGPQPVPGQAGAHGYRLPPLPGQQPAYQDEDPEALWEARPYLATIRDYAREHHVAPWAVLGTVFARVIAATEPNIQLPAIIGKPASLNFLVALVGPPGSGKDAALDTATDAVDIRGYDGGPHRIDYVPIGSGEGITDVYMKLPPRRRLRPRQEDGVGEDVLGLDVAGIGAIQYRTRALITIREIDTFEAISQRRGSTAAGQIRQGYNGQQLGFFNRAEEKRLLVPAHQYRLCMIAGVQPARAGILLDDADGGTPQRFIWMPAIDPDAPPTDQLPSGVPGLLWSPPVYQAQVLFRVCDAARDAVLQARDLSKRGQGDPATGHLLLTREKIAAALAMLDNEDRDPKDVLTITEHDWWLSGLVVGKSEQTRLATEQALRDSNAIELRQKAEAAAIQATYVDARQDEERLRRVSGRIVARLGKLPKGDWLPRRVIMKMGSSGSPIAEALESLVSQGVVETQDVNASGNATQRVRLAQG